jgi:hypothetical protein
LVEPIEFDTISNYPSKYYSHEQNFPTFWAKRNFKYYLFDTLGNWLDSIEYDNIKVLHANFYLVTKDGKSWRIDRNGGRVIEDFTVIRDDEEYYIAKKGSGIGLVDLSGAIILPFKYEDINCEHLGNFFVKKNGKWGVVDEENHQLLPCKYDYIAYAWDNSDKNAENYIVVQNDKFGKVTETGAEIFPCLYDGITRWVEYGPKGHYVMLGDKMGLIDYNGKTLIPVKYEKVSYLFETDWATIYDKGKMGLYNIKNNSFLLPLAYDNIFVDHDWIGCDEHKPTRIITCRNGIVNVLDEKANIIQSGVSKTEIKKNFGIDIDAYRYSMCSFALSLMVHNRTYKFPDCLIETLKKYDIPVESVYYNMVEKR